MVVVSEGKSKAKAPLWETTAAVAQISQIIFKVAQWITHTIKVSEVHKKRPFSDNKWHFFITRKFLLISSRALFRDGKQWIKRMQRSGRITWSERQGTSLISLTCLLRPSGNIPAKYSPFCGRGHNGFSGEANLILVSLLIWNRNQLRRFYYFIFTGTFHGRLHSIITGNCLWSTPPPHLFLPPCAKYTGNNLQPDFQHEDISASTSLWLKLKGLVPPLWIKRPVFFYFLKSF